MAVADGGSRHSEPMPCHELPADVAGLIVRDHGVVLTTRAAVAGIGEGRLRRLAAQGSLRRLSRGCYVDREAYDGAGPWVQHRLKAVAVTLLAGRSTFLAGWSAAVVWELPTLGAPPALVDSVRSREMGRRPSVGTIGRIRPVQLPGGHGVVHDGVAVMSRAWTAVDLARRTQLPHALAVADAVARMGEDMGAVLGYQAHWPGAERARWVAEHADPLAESPIESLGRFACLAVNLPMPVSNAWIGADRPRYRVDGLWPWHWAAARGRRCGEVRQPAGCLLDRLSTGRTGVGDPQARYRPGPLRVGLGLQATGRAGEAVRCPAS